MIQQFKTRARFGLMALMASLALVTGFGCGTSGGGGSSTAGVYQNPNQPHVTAGAANAIPITMSCGYVNEPCVSATVCVPGTATCVTVNNLLLDTGSVGLRVFSSALNGVTFPKQADPHITANQLAECIQYGDGSSTWGGIYTGDIQLGGEKATSVPFQVINATVPTPPTSSTACPNKESNAQTAGFNGILGVGLFPQDCGTGCAQVTNNKVYYTCTGSSACTMSSVAVASQVQNPVAMLPSDNNGVMVQLPNIADAGASSLSGWLVLGVGTQTNNTPVTATLFKTDSVGNFSTSFNGTTASTSFIDSGSNAIYFPAPSSVTACTGTYAGFYCPSSSMSFTATQIGAGSTGQATISFTAANANSLLSSSNPNIVFNDLTGNLSSDFDWGLPFFIGRSIFVGISGTTSSSGTGPYWVY